MWKCDEAQVYPNQRAVRRSASDAQCFRGAEYDVAGGDGLAVLILCCVAGGHDHRNGASGQRKDSAGKATRSLHPVSFVALFL